MPIPGPSYGWQQRFIDSKGVVKWGDYLYCYIETDETHIKIMKAPCYTTADPDPSYTIPGDEELEKFADAADVTIAAVVREHKFIGANGKIYLWDGLGRVIIFDIATMAIERTDDYDFNITEIACDSDAYYIGRSGVQTEGEDYYYEETQPPDEEMARVYRIPLSGDITVYVGYWASTPLDKIFHEHYVEYIYINGDKMYVSCGYNSPAGDPPPAGWEVYTGPLRWISQIDIATMTRITRSGGFQMGPPLSGFSDMVFDDNYLYVVPDGSGIFRFPLTGAMSYDQYWSVTGLISWLQGNGLLYYDGKIYISTYGHMYIIDCATEVKTDLGGTYNVTLYHAATDGTTIWYDWSYFTVLAGTSTASPTYAAYKLFRWIYVAPPGTIVHSFPWWKHFQMCKVKEVV
jgi:hypothetical protein